MERLVRIYETARFDLVRVLVGDKGPVSAVAWSPDGKQLATGSEDGTVRFWQADGTPRAAPPRAQSPRYRPGLEPRRQATGLGEPGHLGADLGAVTARPGRSSRIPIASRA